MKVPGCFLLDERHPRPEPPRRTHEAICWQISEADANSKLLGHDLDQARLTSLMQHCYWQCCNMRTVYWAGLLLRPCTIMRFLSRTSQHCSAGPDHLMDCRSTDQFRSTDVVRVQQQFQQGWVLSQFVLPLPFWMTLSPPAATHLDLEVSMNRPKTEGFVPMALPSLFE